MKRGGLNVMKNKILWSFAIMLILVVALALGVNAQDNTETVNDVFEFMGFSISPSGTDICLGYRVNYEAMEEYEAQIGNSVDIGCVFASYELLGGLSPLDESGKPRSLPKGKVISVSLNGLRYVTYDLRLSGFTEEHYSHRFVIAAYLFDGENVFYYQNDEVSQSAMGLTYAEILNENHEHEYTSAVDSKYLRTEATCEQNATYFDSCSLCGKKANTWFEAENTALDHVVEIIEGVAPTCTQSGISNGSYCLLCNAVLEAQVALPATGHIYEVVSSKSTAPTLNAAGKKVSTCVGCADTKTETVNKLSASKVTKDQVYDITTGEYNPALNNIWKMFDGVTATSDLWSAGNDWFGNIGDILTITLDQEMYVSSMYVYLGGNYTFATVRVKNAAGVVTASNSVCANANPYGGDGNRITVFSGKNILAYTIEIEITSLKWESARTFKLSEIELNAADIDLSFDHTHVYRDFVQQSVVPTCQSEGKEEYACYCGKTAEFGVPVLDHSYDTLSSVIAATCSENGKEIYSCSCGKTSEVVLVAKGHIYEKLVSYVSEPTLSRVGSAIYQCIGCELRQERTAPMLPLEEIKYLRVSQITGSSVTLKFNILSEPVSYEVRYSTSEITEGNFQNATACQATVSDNSEISLVINLDASLINGYYVAVRPYCGDNVGEISTLRVGGNELIHIDYSDARVYHGESLSSFQKLFDEQSESYKNGTLTPSSTLGRINTDSSDTLLYGMTLAPIVDLEYKHFVSNVYLYYAEGGATVKVRWSRTPVDFQAEDALWDGCYEFTSVAGWNTVNVSEDTRYVQIVFTDGQAPTEMLLYGYQSGDGDEITLSQRENATIGDMMGMCGFVAWGGGNTPIDSVICSTVMREYHNFGWSYDLNAYLGKPAKFEGSWMCNFDTQYRDYTAAGLNVIPCVQWDLKSINVSNKVDENNVPIIDNGAFIRSDFYDRFNPHTYFMYADSMFTFAARYGSNSSAELAEIAAQRTIDKTQVVGLGYLKWIELGNEPDGTWNGIHNYYAPYQYAALLSAGYDGHCRTMTSSVLESGYHFGIKTADSTMGVAMAGIAAADCRYVNSINYWMMANRADGKVAYDAFNGHHYMTKQIQIEGNKFTVGVSPEEGKLKEVMSIFVNLRDKYYSDKEVWITEFGWDTNQSYTTETSSHAYANYTGRQVQAMWLTRSYLLLSSCGVDKATMYMCEDAGIDSEVSGKYGTCGVIGYERDENGNTVEVKKDSYFYLYTLKNTLGDFSFKREITAYDENVMIYEYESKDGRTAYAVWCKTSDGTVSENYQLGINASSATLVEAVYGDIDGVRTSLTSDSLGYVSINVSENPVYVLVD